MHGRPFQHRDDDRGDGVAARCCAASSSRPRSSGDIYALGVLLYRLLAERLPFDVADLPWAEAVQCALEAVPAPLAAADPSLAGPIEQIVLRAMARDRDRRYQTAAELAADLQRFVDGRAPLAAQLPIEPRAIEARPTPMAIAIGAADGVVHVWELSGARLVPHTARQRPAPRVARAVPTGRIAIAWSDGRVDILAAAPAEC